MRTQMLVFLVSIVAHALAVPGVHACSCGEATIEELYGYADAVFSGEVTHVQIDDFECAERGVTMTVTVMDCWKGDLEEIELVYTTYDEGCCGLPLDPGTYLFFAHEYTSGEWAGDLWTGLCSGTRALAAAGEVLDYLGEPGCVPLPTKPSSWASIKDVHR